MPRLHSNVALRSDLHSSGRSSAWCFRQSDGRFPCFMTQSDCMRQSLSAAIRFWHEEAMGEMRKNLESHDWRTHTCHQNPRRAWTFDRLDADNPANFILFHLYYQETKMPPPILRPILRNTPTLAPVPNRSAMSISGSQAGIFLNGMLSSAVHEPMKGPLYSSFLHAQAR